MSASTNYGQSVARAGAFMDLMHLMKQSLRTPREQYEDLRERYASGSINLEDFTAQVVTLLRKGL